MERKKRKWLSYVLSAAILTVNALSGGVSTSAATLTQDNQVVKMDFDEEGRMVYTLTGNMDKGLNLALESGETVVVDGNGYTINGEKGVAASYSSGAKRASAALSVKGEGIVLLKDITLVGGAGNNDSLFNGEAANGVCVTDNASVICQGNVAILAGKSAADPQASADTNGDNGCEGMWFEGNKLLVDKGAHLEIKGGDGGEGHRYQSDGGNGMYFAGNALQVEQTASISITGGKGSVGKADRWGTPEKGGKGGNALQLVKGRVDASLTEQKASAADNGVVTLTPGLGGEASDPTAVSAGDIGAPIDYISGYVSDRDMIDESGTQSKKLTITYCLGEGNLFDTNNILEQKNFYTMNDTINSVDEIAAMPNKLSKTQRTRVFNNENYDNIVAGKAIQDGMKIIVLCRCDHDSDVQLKAGSENSYLCNTCGAEMKSSFTDQKGNVRYSAMYDYISYTLLCKAEVGETIRLLNGKDSCGENLTWSVLKLTDKEKFRLVVEGTGVFGKSTDRPWILEGDPSVPDSQYITDVEIKSGVTGIAENAFSTNDIYTNLKKIQIPNGTAISDKAFQNSSTQLSEIEVTANEQAATNLTKADLIKGGFPENITYKFPVTFVGNNKEATSSVTYEYGNTVSPVTISYSDYTLLGWYQTPTFKEGTEWNFDTNKVQGAVMLYAKWKSNNSSDEGGSDVKPTATPTVTPTIVPTIVPTQKPTTKPTVKPTKTPIVTQTPKKSKKVSVSKKLVEPVKAEKTSNQLYWNPVKGADGYFIYASLCNEGGKQRKMVKIADIKKNTVTSYVHKNCKKNTWYKYRIVAYQKNGKQQVKIQKSLELHSLTKGSKKYANPSSVKIQGKKNLRIKEGNTKKIRAQVILPKGKKTKKHIAQIRYIVEDKSLLTVTKKGKIKAKKAGSTVIYAVAQNGASSKIKVKIV